MNIKYLQCLPLFILVTTPLSAAPVTLTPRKERQPLTSSIIVPCVARHFFWLSGLLESYENQTVKPDEIVISISEVEKLNPKEITDLENGNWSFKLVIIRNKNTILDGDNRTIAMDHASGDILIFSDADDIPHPQRVELSKFIFENYEIDHILHSLTFLRNELSNFNVHDIPTLKFTSFNAVLDFAYKNNIPITSGSPCFLNKIGKKIKWEAIKDAEHAHMVYTLFKNTIVIPLKLILYRMHLSSHSSQRSGAN